MRSRIFIRISLGLILLLLLISVRAFERAIFYDPFSDYFDGDYLSQPFPQFDSMRLFANLALRYFLNTLFSLGIIYVLFDDTALVRFSAFLYFILFLILITAFFIVISYFDHHSNFALFYVRRFLIQPLFVLLFVPAFYYQLKLQKK